MSDKPEDFDVMYYQLVLSMQASTMQHLGKVMSPVSGKIERNIEAARYSIDMLEMLQRKTTGNLTSDEQKLLEHVLHQLRLNYLDESGKKESPEKPESQDATQDTSADKVTEKDEGEANRGANPEAV